MAASLISKLSENDIFFVVETVDPKLLNKMDVIKDDPDIIERIIEHELSRLFKRIMQMNDDAIMSTITPRLLFEVLIRTAHRDLERQAYTLERTASQRLPVFDSPAVVRFLNNKSVLNYLADMLDSFTKIESITYRTRVREGIWRKTRYNDMDINSLLKFCQAIDEERRFSYYKRIADLCLFILGIFPEYVSMDYSNPFNSKEKPKPFNRPRWSAEDYEVQGSKFYRLAGEHKDAIILNQAEVLFQLHKNFYLAKKPLNYISERFLRFKKAKLFP